MKIKQLVIDNPTLSSDQLSPLADIDPNLVLVFASPDYFADSSLAESLQQRFPNIPLAGCSTAGEISTQGVTEEGAVISALHFDGATEIAIGEASVPSMADSRPAGRQIGEALQGPGLRAILLFGKGVDINGSALIEGVVDIIGPEIPITGGLGGDNGAFAKTYVISTAGVSSEGVVGVGFYGADFKVGHGSYGGWSSFGPIRKVTRCEGNVLYELDGQPALQIYKDYLGEYADQLPASGLLFPFEMLTSDEHTAGLIRTILGVDEEQGSLVLAGEIDSNGFLRLMHASTDALVDGAEEAARLTLGDDGAWSGEQLAILVSCVGRKLVMGDQVEDEVDAVIEVLGDSSIPAGFYSYGEISPFSTTTECKLHNQTMTVTMIGEK